MNIAEILKKYAKGGDKFYSPALGDVTYLFCVENCDTPIIVIDKKGDRHKFTSEGDLVIVEEVEEPKWADDKDAKGEGWFISRREVAAGVNFALAVRLNDCFNYHAFATEKQAKSALAMARISQLMAHDARYGGVITDEEWENGALEKYAIRRYNGKIDCSIIRSTNFFLAFHTKQQRELFLSENEQLVKDYLMID